VLIIFIDSLPYERVKEMNYLSSMNSVSPLKPGFGYSVNLHAELFSGKTPDEIGFFGEWVYDENHRKQNILSKFLYGFLNKIERNWLFGGKLLHYAIKRILKRDTAYIPFNILHLFEQRGTYPLTDKNNTQSILTDYSFSEAISDYYRKPVGEKDIVALESARKYIRNKDKNIFVSLCDLDGIAHEYGTNSDHYKNRLVELDGNCSELIEGHLKNHPNDSVYICSDHGMSNASIEVDLDLEGRFGYPNPDKLVYFYDSLYLHVWSKDEKILSDVSNYLNTRKEGCIISSSERSEYCISSKKFGDVVYLLHENHAFNPNYFGYFMLKAYHGYHPDLKSSKGIFISNSLEIPESTIDVYPLLKSNLVK
jgi:predicted AlkP superfamily pyrophosphatase or phosphodiesterase